MKEESSSNLQKIVESLNPQEKRILPFLDSKDLDELIKKSKLDKTSCLRALEFLSNKKIVKLNFEDKKIVDLGVNGVLYLRVGLPERRLVNVITEGGSLSLEDAKEKSGLNDNEFKAALGVLKKKLLVNIINGKIILQGKKQDIIEKSLEEKFLESLPKSFEELAPEEKYAFENLKSRKNIIVVKKKSIVRFEPTELGKKLMDLDPKTFKDLIERVTPQLLKTNGWRGKKFRRYDMKSPVPEIYGGKKHFVNQVIEYAKKIWIEMGFKEMKGNLVDSSFWNFDALFTAQDHPVREMHDTFFIKDKEAKLPEDSLVQEVKKAHEGKIEGSKGWGGEWKEEEAKRVILRTHTTCISAHALKKIAEKKEFPAKYFAIGRCFRNETVDWSHNFEFNQTEGIVVDENANFKQLIGYLVEFFKKMGYEKIRIRPSFFPYTEPSLEIEVFHPERKEWLELGGAGIFRPETVIPFFGRYVPVLAWGPGFDRILMEFFNITDLREMYKNDLDKLRRLKIWDK